MKGTTHLAFGLAAAALVPSPEMVDMVALAVGAILPDIDKSTSLVGRHVPVIPRLLPHRTITHSLLFVAAMCLLNRYLGLGCALHLILDMCNPEGVPLLWPLKKHMRIPLIAKAVRSGGWADKVIGSVVWLAVFVLYGYAIYKGQFPPKIF